MWNHRLLCASLGAVTACTGAASAPSPVPKEKPVVSTVSPPVSAPANVDPGFRVTDGAAPFVVDGDRLVELHDGAVILRDAKLAETSRVGTGVKSFAVLPRHGIAVRSGLTLQVLAGGTTTTYANALNDVVATDKSDEVWQVSATMATRSALVKDADAHRVRAKQANKLPDGARAIHATLADGNLAIASQDAILVASAAGLASFAASGVARHLGAGPAANTVWASDSARHGVTLWKLADGKATALATHALPASETVVHMAGAGAHAAAVVAHGQGPQVTYSLVAFTAKGEAWRAPLGSAAATYLVALDAKRVVVRAQQFRAFDVATGKPL